MKQEGFPVMAVSILVWIFLISAIGLVFWPESTESVFLAVFTGLIVHFLIKIDVPANQSVNKVAITLAAVLFLFLLWALLFQESLQGEVEWFCQHTGDCWYKSVDICELQ